MTISPDLSACDGNIDADVKLTLLVSLQAGIDFVAQSGLSGFPQVLMNGSPLKKQYLSQDSFEEGVVNEILKATPALQKAVYHVSMWD